MSALKVYACVEWDEPTGTCSAHAYIDPPTIIPTMTAEEGLYVGWQLVTLYVVVRVVVLLREAIRDRI
ncbi:hypothetical protein [Lysobacter sp. D1-1-M9]|uniref:hypothetical protein n=1 Tax=Novilysobacter longmucuonensis TaxID=3098603 RepID=UPI002FC6DA40